MDKDHRVLIHLSDIHFKSLLPPHDLDKQLRDSLEADASEFVNLLDHVDGILVTGDVAFSGKEEEYDRAVEWLAKLSDLVKCSRENVWAVPGNHDVEWSIIEKSKMLRNVHNDLRTVPPNKIDNCLLEYINDPDVQKRIFEPIKNFNFFAAKFGMPSIDSTHLFWEHDIRLNDESVLRLHAMNSTIVSDATDGTTNKVVLSAFQLDIKPDPGVAYLTLCHHPPHWLREMDLVEDCLDNRVSLQLFGHKHRQRLIRRNDSLQLSAGAVHPPREEEDWQPRYNFLALKVDGVKIGRKLRVKVWPRVWKKENFAFRADYTLCKGKELAEYELPLKDWSAKRVGIATEVGKRTHSVEAEKLKVESVKEEVQMEPKRKLVYRLLNLPYHEIIEIAVRLKLLRDEDNVDKVELYKRLIARAESAGQFEQIWELLNSYTREELPNPFRRAEQSGVIELKQTDTGKSH